MNLSELNAAFDWIVHTETASTLGKLILSTGIGILIGYEREFHGQSAGLRTNTLVCLASCLLMQLSLYLPELYSQLSDESVLRIDPGRIASYAVAGMGFLGAGAIIKGKGSVRGLTTAAGLWTVTALGLTIGAGLYLPALIATLICLPILYNIKLMKPSIVRDEYTILTIKCCCEDRPLKEIKNILKEHRPVKIDFINYHEDRENLQVSYKFRLLSKEDTAWGEIVTKLLEFDSILEISWQEADVP